ncbi:unnamed protein product (macronuclear) [Paramecium tetraurelia]|uniref:VWFA domain-containing protein n=1 Tax=Paramecium tetraurelia TaxID=5888 RepID=A0E5Z0_PARTE|nr:uncharacterized protein GSPATT00003570001 [Paramecium tetraurelia]CAK90707.1 unnamed protein product [Paramecium tetraurelia]|eukprot:XP_001458104.1 hypothetical protein (macronuclear) [Paramecium tetraurelia strain d4-2]
MDQEQKYHFHIPFVNNQQEKKEETKLTIIGLIDVSASMYTRWEWVANFWNKSIPKDNLITLTFDHRAKKVHNNVLSQNIEDHGEGTTEIVPAFELLETEIVKVPKNHNITVIFISDGQDNHVNTIEQRMKQRLKGNVQKRNINFICLGIEDEFPTFLAMQLRQLYHKGDPQIPALYLIEHASEQAFHNKFEIMKRYFYSTKMLQVNNVVNLFPYDEEVTDEVYEGQWVYSSKSDLKFINYPDVQIIPIEQSQLEIDDVVDLFRSWVQNIQIRIMGKHEDSREKAKKCLQIVNSITNRLTEYFQMDVLNFKMEEINDPNQPFKIRAKRNYAYKYGNKLLFFVKELAQLSEGSNPNEVDDFEAAKRLNIGTIVGKHHQKALALKGITVQEFKQIREEFQQIIQNCKINPQNEQGQERSVISLENFRDILSQKQDILEGLKFVKTQYDFAETFPLVGHGLKVKRNDGSFVNPWLIQVQSFAKHNKVIDSAYLIKNNFNVQLQIGDNQTEEINCILPLFPQSDNDLQAVLRSRIIKLLLTFMVQQNVDTLYEETYLALLSNSLINVLKKQKSQWQTEIMEQIFETTKLVYSGTKNFENYLQKLLHNPNQAYLEKEAEYEDYVSTAKPFIHLFYLSKLGNVVKDFELEIERLIIYYFIREQYKHQQQLSYFLKLKLEKQDENFVQEQLKATFEKHVSIKNFRNSITKEIEDTLLDKYQKDSTVIGLNEDKVFNQDLKLTLDAIETFYEQFKGVKFDQQRYVHIIYHALKLQEKDVFLTRVNYNNLKEIQKAMISENKGNLTKGASAIKLALEKEYQVWFIKNHMLVQPLTYEQLQIECQQKGININTIAYNVKSGLSSNCCMAKQCPYYLIVNGLDFKRHVQTWGRKVPQGFHQYVRSEILKGQNIEQIIQSSTQKWKKFPKLYLGNEDIVHQYIKLISESLPMEYQIKELPKEQLLHHQVKLTFPQKQKVKKYGNKRGQNRQNQRGGYIRGRGRGRGRGKKH